jgi:hypothetical protein
VPLKNELLDPKTATKSVKYRDIRSIMKDPAAKAKLTNNVDEAVRSKQKIFTEQQTIKDLRDLSAKDIGIHPKLFNLYVQSAFNNDYSTRKTALEEMVDLIDSVIGIAGPESSHYTGDGDDE